MLPFALAVAAVATGLYFLSGGARIPIAEGRSWRVVPPAQPLAYMTKLADAAARLAGERAVVMVAITSKVEKTSTIPVMVVVDQQIGPKALRGHFDADGDHPIPAPWGPKPGTAVNIHLEDVVLILKD